MSLARASDDRTKNWKAVTTGIMWGLTAALAWAGYNVGSRLGRMDGLSAMDMSMVRFGIAALVLVPFVLSRRNEHKLGWGRLLVLLALAGPLFGLLINTAFGLAPLSHAVVLTAGATMVSATGLAWIIDHKAPPVFRLLGMAVLIAGLVVIAAGQDGQEPQSSARIWLGDLCFAAAGTLWGIFTYLIGRWKVDPVVGIGHVSILSTLAFLPFFLTLHTGGSATSGAWLSQVFFQGILGGCLGPIAIAKAISHLGAPEASLFPSLVPSGALLLAIPLLGEWPTSSEVLGVAICTLGLLTAFNIMRLFRDMLSR
ncbi:drug/metabolite transporter (DMT)-like permease [Microvirga flocculans]|uniref:Drug/metabolite transporter (DMT)-like permease n=1 Tax=Microvirga flocculans TaxID=217168 RepID=A0A7W6IHW6_9HYPH|nr:DMT family transporter [Microvirga flocculans]MBB4041779.1 drug/metabolite transporter (DMT)-like permease [Microvirga flocculans]